MSFNKFKPIVWAAEFQEELDKVLVYKEDCNLEYEGVVEEAGDTVKILGLGEPSITNYEDGTTHEIESFEDIEDESQTMPVMQVAQFAFKVKDIDKAQAKGGKGVLSKYMQKAKTKVATEQDSFMARMCTPASLLTNANAFGMNVTKVAPAASRAAGTDAGYVSYLNVMDWVDTILTYLLERDVSRDTKITFTIPPWLTMIIKKAYIDLDTNNSEMLKNGKVGRYSNIILKESNNVYLDSNGYYHCLMRTDDAMAFVNPLIHVEPLRIEKDFSDAVKGFAVYDGKVVRPKEIIDFMVKRSA